MNPDDSTRAARLFRHIVRKPWPYLLAIGIVTLAAAAQLPKVRVAADLKLLIPRDEVFQTDLEITETFGIRDSIAIGVFNSAGAFNVETIAYTKTLIENIEDVAGIEGVRSLFSEDSIAEIDGDIRIDPYLLDVNEEEIAQAARFITDFPAAQGVIASEDLTCLALLAELEPGVDRAVVTRAVKTIIEARPPPDYVRLHLSGMALFEGVLGDYIVWDVLYTIPVVTLITAILLFLAFRSIPLVLLALVEMGVVNVLTLGLMAALGVPLHMVHATLPAIIVALVVADEIHIFSKFFQLYTPDRSREDTVVEAMTQLWVPIALTSATTAFGFLGFLATTALPQQLFGVFTAFGILCAMVFSLIVTPIILARWGNVQRSDEETPLRRMMGTIGVTVFSNRPRFVVAVLLLLGIAGYGIANVYTQDSWIGNFKAGSDVRQSFDFLNDKMLGMRLLQLELDTGEEEGALSPDFLKRLAAFQEDVEANSVAGGTISMAQAVMKMNEEFAGSYSIPDEAMLIAQYMILLEGSSYEDLWDFPKQKARVVVFATRGDYLSGDILYPAIDEAKAKHLPEVELRKGGDYALGYHWVDLLSQNLAQSLAASLVLIVLSSTIFYRSIRKGLTVVLPIVVSIAFHFGVIGLTGIPFNVAASMFSSIILGIGVDFAIHLQSMYHHYRKDESDAKEAFRRAASSTGEAIVWSTAVVVLSFLAFLLSQMPPTQQLGVMVALGIVSSLAASFLVVPLLLPRR